MERTSEGVTRGKAAKTSFKQEEPPHEDLHAIGGMGAR